MSVALVQVGIRHLENVGPMYRITFKNLILRRLDQEVIDSLELRRVDLPLDREIEYPGDRIEHLYFLEEGIASMTATFADGSEAEIAIAGSESVLATASLMGARRSLNRVYMQVAGFGHSSPISAAAREFKRGQKFHDLILRYRHAQFIQSAQTAGCNARHTVEQRMARWLLLCSDRAGDRLLPLSHDHLADMLGVTRSSVTIVAGHLQDRNLIQYARGRIHLLDLPGLEAMSCECYRVVRDHLHSLAQDDDLSSQPQ